MSIFIDFIPNLCVFSWWCGHPLYRLKKTHFICDFLLRPACFNFKKSSLILNKSHFDFRAAPNCTKANSALSPCKSLIFALSPFKVKVPAAISSSPSPNWLIVCIYTAAVHGSHPSWAPSTLQGGGGVQRNWLCSSVRRPVLFQCAYCLTL